MTGETKRTFLRLLTSTLALAGLSRRTQAQPDSTNMDLLGEIARQVVGSGELDDVDWSSFTIAFEIDDDGDVQGTYGYAYDRAAKATAFAVRPSVVNQSVAAYREWLRQAGDKGFIKMLFQLDRETRKVNAEFEYDDRTRWQVTPKNIDTIVEELRPRLSE